MAERVCDVLVVGAGPTGLMLANWLARLGVDVVIVDRKDGPTRESRALGVQARSVEIYDQLGVIDSVLAESRQVPTLVPGYERRSFGPIPIGELGTGLTPYPRIYILEQSRNEQILLDALRETGHDVMWSRLLEDLTVGELPDGAHPSDASHHPVVATFSNDAGEGGGDVVGDTEPLTVRARYCVGADGSSSAVRKLRGIPFDGLTNEHIFYVCDARGVSGIRRGSINVRFGHTEFLLSFPMGGDHDRLLGVVPAATRVRDEDIVEDEVRQRIDDTFGVRYRDSAWFATYRVHHRMASVFRDGPVFLAGDAAHVHSPVGAQGMNTGLQDAHNLAFTLADVVKGRADDSALDRYEAERMPVARNLVETTDRVFAFVTSDRVEARLVRRWVLPLVMPIATRVVPGARGANRLFQYVSQIRIHYWMGDEARERARGVRDAVVGRRLVWVPTADGSNFDSLRSLEWQVHEYGRVDPAVVRRIGDELGVAVRVFPAAARTPLVAGMFYLVRDGFVAAKARASDASRVFRVFVNRVQAPRP
ncbi:FAD-dependent monooxygenase [Okibacterium endophyticum]